MCGGKMEQTTPEQVVEILNSLPTDDRERFNEWFGEQEQLIVKRR